MSSQHELVGGAEAGEPESPVAVEQPTETTGDATTATAAAKAGEPATDEWESVRKLDWNKIPADIRQKAELPFLQEKTRAQQQLLGQQQAIIDAYIAKTGAQPTPDELDTIKERVRSGDPEAIIEMMETAIQRQVGPVLTQNTLKAQIEDAESRIPELKDRAFQNLVGQTIQADPVARELVSAGGHKFASVVIQQIARNILYERKSQEFEQLKGSIEAAKKAAVEEYRKTVAGLPGKTTLAGTTAGRDGKQAAGSLKEAARQAWLEAGGGSDDFL